MALTPVSLLERTDGSIVGDLEVSGELDGKNLSVIETWYMLQKGQVQTF